MTFTHAPAAGCWRIGAVIHHPEVARRLRRRRRLIARGILGPELDALDAWVRDEMPATACRIDPESVRVYGILRKAVGDGGLPEPARAGLIRQMHRLGLVA